MQGHASVKIERNKSHRVLRYTFECILVIHCGTRTHFYHKHINKFLETITERKFVYLVKKK